MTRRGCPLEPAVVAAVHAEAWSEELRRHVASCRECQQTEAVTSALLALAAEDSAMPLPDPHATWLRARLARRRAANRKLRLILATMPTIGGALALALGAFAFQSLWPRLRDLVISFELPTTSGDPSALLVLAATAAVLALLATWNRLLTPHH